MTITILDQAQAARDDIRRELSAGRLIGAPDDYIVRAYQPRNQRPKPRKASVRVTVVNHPELLTSGPDGKPVPTPVGQEVIDSCTAILEARNASGDDRYQVSVILNARNPLADPYHEARILETDAAWKRAEDELASSTTISTAKRRYLSAVLAWRMADRAAGNTGSAQRLAGVVGDLSRTGARRHILSAEAEPDLSPATFAEASLDGIGDELRSARKAWIDTSTQVTATAAAARKAHLDAIADWLVAQPILPGCSADRTGHVTELSRILGRGRCGFAAQFRLREVLTGYHRGEVPAAAE